MYYADGSRREGNFLNGKKQGIFKYYDRHGQYQGEREYDHGRLVQQGNVINLNNQNGNEINIG